MKHEQLAWVPMCIPDKGSPFFFDLGVRGRQREARDAFIKYCGMPWAELRKEGWRIVRVRLSHHS